MATTTKSEIIGHFYCDAPGRVTGSQIHPTNPQYYRHDLVVDSGVFTSSYGTTSPHAGKVIWGVIDVSETGDRARIIGANFFDEASAREYARLVLSGATPQALEEFAEEAGALSITRLSSTLHFFGDDEMRLVSTQFRGWERIGQ